VDPGYMATLLKVVSYPKIKIPVGP